MEGYEGVDYSSDHLDSHDIWGMPDAQFLGTTTNLDFLEVDVSVTDTLQSGLAGEIFSPSVFLTLPSPAFTAIEGPRSFF